MQVLSTVFDVLGDRCEVPAELAGACADVLYRHGISPDTSMATLTVIFDKICIMATAKDHYGPQGMYRAAINVLCEIMRSRSSIGDDEFCDWAKNFVRSFRFDREEARIVDDCLSELEEILPPIFNLDNISKTFAPVEHMDMPMVAVFADLPMSATRRDIFDVVQHLERTTDLRVPHTYVDVVTNMYNQRVLLIKIPR